MATGVYRPNRRAIRRPARGFVGTKAAALGPPVNNVAPAVTGNVRTGQTLTVDTGTWTPA